MEMIVSLLSTYILLASSLVYSRVLLPYLFIHIIYHIQIFLLGCFLIVSHYLGTFIGSKKFKNIRNISIIEHELTCYPFSPGKKNTFSLCHQHLEYEEA